MKKKHNMKKTISISMFISEFDETFTSHMRKKLLEIRNSCILIRKASNSGFDLQHVEHTKHIVENSDDSSNSNPKEYTFGQLLVDEDILYFSNQCMDSDVTVQHPAIFSIYNSLDMEAEVLENNLQAKRIDDSNIDFLVDHLAEIYPPLSKEYLDIIRKYNRS